MLVERLDNPNNPFVAPPEPASMEESGLGERIAKRLLSKNAFQKYFEKTHKTELQLSVAQVRLFMGLRPRVDYS